MQVGTREDVHGTGFDNTTWKPVLHDTLHLTAPCTVRANGVHAYLPYACSLRLQPLMVPCRCYAAALLCGIGVSTLLLALCVLASLSQRSLGDAECTAHRPAFAPAAGLSHHASVHLQHAFYDSCGPVHPRWVPGAAGAKSASCKRSAVYIGSAFLDLRPMLLGQAAEVGAHRYATHMPN